VKQNLDDVWIRLSDAPRANRFGDFERRMTGSEGQRSPFSVAIEPQSLSDIFPNSILRGAESNEHRRPTICRRLIFVRCLTFERRRKRDVNSKILEIWLGLALRETAPSVSVNPKGPVRQHRIFVRVFTILLVLTGGYK
jgi:hypothetical protein